MITNKLKSSKEHKIKKSPLLVFRKAGQRQKIFTPLNYELNLFGVILQLPLAGSPSLSPFLFSPLQFFVPMKQACRT